MRSARSARSYPSLRSEIFLFERRIRLWLMGDPNIPASIVIGGGLS